MRKRAQAHLRMRRLWVHLRRIHRGLKMAKKSDDVCSTPYGDALMIAKRDDEEEQIIVLLIE